MLVIKTNGLNIIYNYTYYIIIRRYLHANFGNAGLHHDTITVFYPCFSVNRMRLNVLKGAYEIHFETKIKFVFKINDIAIFVHNFTH